jgi:hypothetical protein
VRLGRAFAAIQPHEADTKDFARRLLRTRGERPSGGGTEKRYELTPSHGHSPGSGVGTVTGQTSTQEVAGCGRVQVVASAGQCPLWVISVTFEMSLWVRYATHARHAPDNIAISITCGMPCGYTIRLQRR